MNRRRHRAARVTVVALAVADAPRARCRPPSPPHRSTTRQARVEQLTDELERLEEKSDILAEDYVTAIDEKNRLDAEVAAAEQKVAAKQAEVDALRGELSQVAVAGVHGRRHRRARADVHGLRRRSPTICSATSCRASRSSAGTATTDELEQAVSDLNEERAALEATRNEARRQGRAGRAGQAGDRREEGRVRRRPAPTPRPSSAAGPGGRGAPRPGVLRADAARGRGGRRPPGRPRRSSAQAQAQSPAALQSAVAVAAAAAAQQVAAVASAAPAASAADPGRVVTGRDRRQRGDEPARHAVPLRRRRSRAWPSTARPDVVGLGPGRRVAARTSPAPSTAASPHVPTDAAQPGDLLFFYSPISHVSIYLGGGQHVHAPNSGNDGRRSPRSTGATSSASADPADPAPDRAGSRAPAPATVAGVLEGLDLQTGRPLAGGQHRGRRRAVRVRRSSAGAAPT